MTRPFAAFALALFLSTAHAADEAKGETKPAPAAEPQGSATEPQVSVKGAKNEEATKAKLRADALLARCVIKPVMTDAEIAICKEAYRATDLAQGKK